MMSSSVSRGRGGGARASPLACKVCKIALFWWFWGRFFVKKLKIAPPIRKQPPLKRLDFRFRPKNQSQIRWRPFFFFWRPPDFGRKKTFEFSSFPRNFVSIFGQTVWNWFKNNENSGQGRLHTSYSFKIAPPPPFPNPGYAPDDECLVFFDVVSLFTSISLPETLSIISHLLMSDNLLHERTDLTARDVTKCVELWLHPTLFSFFNI